MVPGSGTAAEPKPPEANPDGALKSLLNEPVAVPLVKITVAPAPMVSELSVWLTLPMRRMVPLPESFTVTAAVSVLRAPFRLVVPSLTVRAL